MDYGRGKCLSKHGATCSMSGTTMGGQVNIKSTPCIDDHSAAAAGGREGPAWDAGGYVFPAKLFDRDECRPDPRWTCVRTRPRWEKKFARWLQGKCIPFYLPTFSRTTVSYRKRRTTIEVLFPGYVFVQGEHKKDAFTRSASVVRLIEPRCQAEHSVVDGQLADIWHAAASGLPLVPSLVLCAGQRIEILDGPMQGTIGRFQRMGRQECVILEIDMLGVGVSVELLHGCRYQAVD